MQVDLYIALFLNGMKECLSSEQKQVSNCCHERQLHSCWLSSNCTIQCCVRAKQQQQQQGHAAALLNLQEHSQSSSSVLVSYSEQQLKMFVKGLHTGIGRE
jgi:hypothetical protein